MNLEKFWGIINKTDVLGIQGEGSAIEKAVEELKKYDKKDMITFHLLFCEYWDLLLEKYHIEKIDCLSDEYDELYWIPTFIIGLGFKTYRYFYKLKMDIIRSLNRLLDDLYIGILFNGEEHNGASYGFGDLDDLAQIAYEEKYGEEFVCDEVLSLQLKEELMEMLEKSR